MNQKPLEHVLQLDQPVELKQGDGLLVSSLLALAEVKGLFLGLSALGTAGAIAYALSLPRYYTASVTLLPPQATSTSGASLAQLGALGSLAGMAGGLKMPSDTYMALLASRRLQDEVIKRFDLRKHYGLPSLNDARKALSSKVTISSDKKTEVISVVVDDLDAKVAASIANGYSDELKKLLSSMALTDAQQRRQFWEQQVAKGQQKLIDSERNFRQLQARSGFAPGQTLAEMGVKANMDLRAQIINKEVQLQALSGLATNRSSEVLRLTAEVTALKNQLRLMEGGSGESKPTVSPAGEESVRAYRVLRVHEVSLESMIRQFEIAKLDEARDAPTVQQVDMAEVPDTAAKSVRRKTAVSGALASIIFSLLFSLGYQRIKSERAGLRDSAVRRIALAWFGSKNTPT
ncbi:MAG: Wzz/FepE/Etk N-terminal domain-containing protein [Aquabacterium sp.]|nr:Wzz/FepE/Etk N-terminal domain-containing protein [Aquabacterium sp.]